MTQRQVLKRSSAARNMTSVMQLCRKYNPFKVISEKPQLKIGPPWSGINISPARHNPSPKNPKMGELSFLEDLAPFFLLPLGTKLLVVIEDKNPVAPTSARH